MNMAPSEGADPSSILGLPATLVISAVHPGTDGAQSDRAVRGSGEVPVFEANVEVVSCYHNFVTWKQDYGENVLKRRCKSCPGKQVLAYDYFSSARNQRLTR